MNFIILNGKKSTEVAGLMIQALPPVVKPPMRVQLDEVDGRDGDIITPLGFSGYDRTVKIGLRGVYDEDDIVEYFNSSGKVIFSNEPDKVYDYTIVESFSLDRLRKFREADVVFHVQPYKHSAVPERNIPAEAAPSNVATPAEPFAMNRTASWYSWNYSDGEFTVSCENGARREWYSDTHHYGRPFPYNNWYDMETSALIMPGTYDIYLTIESGEIVDGGINVGIGSPSTGSIAADQTITSVTPGETIHLTITVTTVIVATYVYLGFVYGTTEDENHYWWCIINNLKFSDLRIVAGVGGGAGINVINRGNVDSAPIYTLEGVRSCSLKVNDNDPVVISADEATDLVIDSENMKAYSGSTLKNRLCTGNYENLHLKPGVNTVSMTGTFTGFIVSDYSRWI